MSLVPHSASSPSIERSGRWQVSETGSLTASWCGASLKFLHTGQSLSIKTGPLTERKDRFNGGTPMLACVISQDSGDADETTLYDLEPSQTLDLFIAELEVDNGTQRIVELTLIDWASIIEIEAFISSPNSIHTPPQIHYARSLHIGDSISCGFSDGSTAIPRGCLDAFPFVTRDALRKEGLMMEIDMVAFPGASLTDPTQEEIDAEGNLPTGLETRFSHASPWSDSEYDGQSLPIHMLVVALGTNDEARDVKPAHYQSSLIALISKVHQEHVVSLKHISILHPFPDFTEEEDGVSQDASPEASLGAHLESFVDALRTRFPYVVVSAYNIGQYMQKDYTMDGLHPTVDGQGILAAAWLDEARKIVKRISLDLDT